MWAYEIDRHLDRIKNVLQRIAYGKMSGAVGTMASFGDEGFEIQNLVMKELDLNPSVVMLFYWSFPPRQVRIDGKVQKLSREAAKLYWESRTRANQAVSAAVRQSSIISGRGELLEKTGHIELIHRGKPIPCPDSWGGYSLVPEKIEFWEGKLDWLHDREKYILNNGYWTKIKLAP